MAQATTSGAESRLSPLTAVLFVLALVAADAALAAQPIRCERTLPIGVLCACKVSELHPTQIAVGMLEVRQRAKKLPEDKEELDAELLKKPAKAVWGPGEKLYIYDGHHLASAALRQSVKRIYCDVTADLSHLTPEAFWARMDDDHRAYPVDAKGRRRPFSEIPSAVAGLQDDPYRSLAWLVRKECGFQKVQEPFAEFRWAEFFRAEIVIETKRRHDIEEEVPEAVGLARSDAAGELPGFCGERCICD